MDALALKIDEIISLEEIEVEAMGWSTAELDVIATMQEAAAVSNAADDQIPAPPSVPVSRRGDLVAWP